MNELEYQIKIAAIRLDVDDYIEDRLGDLCADLGWRRQEWLTLSPAGRVRLFRHGIAKLRLQMVAVSEAFTKAMRPVQKTFAEQQRLILAMTDPDHHGDPE